MSHYESKWGEQKQFVMTDWLAHAYLRVGICVLSDSEGVWRRLVGDEEEEEWECAGYDSRAKWM